MNGLLICGLLRNTVQFKYCPRVAMSRQPANWVEVLKNHIQFLEEGVVWSEVILTTEAKNTLLMILDLYHQESGEDYKFRTQIIVFSSRGGARYSEHPCNGKSYTCSTQTPPEGSRTCSALHPEEGLATCNPCGRNRTCSRRWG